MNIIFKNKGILSLLDITTMGDSIKRDDPTKIGKFDSGLKYALAVLYRNGIEVSILSGDSVYEFDTTTITADDSTKKTKELLVVNEYKVNSEPSESICKKCADIYYNGYVNTGPHNLCEGAHCSDMNDSDEDPIIHVTAFSPQLGYEWKVWMAIRELYSNCLDEGGEVEFVNTNISPNAIPGSTIIFIRNKTSLIINEIIENWNKYFLKDETPIYEYDDLKIFENSDPDSHLRLYKNKILIHENKSVKSRFVYDFKRASIDEMRLLNDYNSYESHIEKCMCYCKDKAFIQKLIERHDEDLFESKLSFYCSLSDEWVNVINDTYPSLTEKGEVFVTNSNLFTKLMEDPRIDIGFKKVKVNSPSYCWADTKVEIINPSLSVTKEKTFEEEILGICKANNFTVTFPVIESKISGLTCVADVHKKVIYVSKNFKDSDMWEMVKSQFRIESDDDPEYCFKQYAKLINNKYNGQ
jgi:hypothetical protein